MHELPDQPPYGAAVIVWRRVEDDVEFLILHRSAFEAEFYGDWAWTPPSGVRQPDESAEEGARRELWEETGLELSLSPTSVGSDNWAVYVAEAPASATVVLDEEHDRFVWLAADIAAERCLPATVGDSIRKIAERLR